MLRCFFIYLKAHNMNWFTQLTGLHSDSHAAVWNGLRYEDGYLYGKSHAQISLQAGHLNMPNLGSLTYQKDGGQIVFSEVVADVQALHADSANAGAVFQVASQTNLLEMISPNQTPEDGVIRYQNDRTQGPACAMACAAGLIYRHYFVPVGVQMGQSEHHQIDTLADLGRALGNENDELWHTQNGYVLPQSAQALERIATQLHHHLAEYRSLVKVGVQQDTQVTLPHCEHVVTQVYASALPMAYSPLGRDVTSWETFARLVLEAAYEATFIIAANSSSRKLYLTRLGGGAFGNPDEWIDAAILKAAQRVSGMSLDVILVSYGGSNHHNQHIIQTWKANQAS